MFFEKGKSSIKSKYMIKINLPNPREMTVPEFFAQMKIALKSAEKSYEEIIRGLDEEEKKNKDNDPWISFRIGELDSLLSYHPEVKMNVSEIQDFLAEDEAQELTILIERL